MYNVAPKYKYRVLIAQQLIQINAIYLPIIPVNLNITLFKKIEFYKTITKQSTIAKHRNLRKIFTFLLRADGSVSLISSSVPGAAGSIVTQTQHCTTLRLLKTEAKMLLK